RLDLSQAGVQNRLGALFFLVVNQTFGVVMPTIGVIPVRRQIILRERASGAYAASAAYLSNWISSLPLALAGSAVLALPIYWIIGFQASATRYLTFLCILIVHTFAANAMGTMLGSSVKSVQLGQILGPLFITVFLIFGGSFLNLDSAPQVFRWIQWISIISYSNKALAQNEFTGLTFTCAPQSQCLTDGSAVIKNFALGTPGIWPSVFINIGLGLAFVAVGYVLFRRTSKPLLRLA
ncbi:ATP-binding cassette sub- G member 2, partial [Phlyctochytrium bullatum]